MACFVSLKGDREYFVGRGSSREHKYLADLLSGFGSIRQFFKLSILWWVTGGG